MKIFNAKQIKECDHFTVEEQNISSVDLMEKAANACFTWLTSKYNTEYTYYIFCGKGNNGGDGLALARILLSNSYKAEVFILQSNGDFSNEAQVNFDRFPTSATFLDTDDFSIPEEKTIIIDALFGIGINKELNKVTSTIVNKINSINTIKIAIDIPTGLYPDKLSKKENEVIFKADYTLSFGFYKRSFLHPESAEYAGEIQVLDIELSQQFIKNKQVQNHIILEEEVIKISKKRLPFSHKGNYGKVVLVGGSYGKIGAVALAAQASLRTGAGIVYTLAPNCGYTILQTLAPEAMFIQGGEKYIEQIELPSSDVVLGIGTGLGIENETKKCLEKLLKSTKNPLVLDADALNIIAEKQTLLKLIPKGSIITPHPKEFSRLFGETKSSLEQCELARTKAVEYKIYIILKGHRTAILTPDGKCYYNINGNSGMAKGGSGDVLTGVLTSLLAQGYTSEHAALFGVYIHGKAGDFAAKKYSQEAMTAQDIIKSFSKVFKDIY